LTNRKIGISEGLGLVSFVGAVVAAVEPEEAA
jgi:hypothetical protein